MNKTRARTPRLSTVHGLCGRKICVEVETRLLLGLIERLIRRGHRVADETTASITHNIRKGALTELPTGILNKLT